MKLRERWKRYGDADLFNHAKAGAAVIAPQRMNVMGTIGRGRRTGPGDAAVFHGTWVRVFFCVCG